jgi:ParB family chromosome partitioning protein
MRKKSSAPRPVSKSANTGQANGDATIAETNVQYLPLCQLALSATNVRKTPATEAEDAELEASIRAHGILQNLIVHGTGIDGRGIYLVDAGGRRLKALQKLAAEGVIDAKHYQVPCNIQQPEDAIETSLTENTVRAAMHPADEFTAMAALIDAGTPIEDVARRRGTTERYVRQRLRLGKLAPELLDASGFDVRQSSDQKQGDRHERSRTLPRHPQSAPDLRSPVLPERRRRFRHH